MCPPHPNGWFSDDIRNLIDRCTFPSLGSRPDLHTVISILDEAGDDAELRSRGVKEEDLIHLLKKYGDGHEVTQGAEAQQMVDMLDSVSQSGSQVS